MKDKPFKIEYRWSEVAKEMRPFLVPKTVEAFVSMLRLKDHAGDFSNSLGAVATKVEMHEDAYVLRLFKYEDIADAEWVDGVAFICEEILTETK